MKQIELNANDQVRSTDKISRDNSSMQSLKTTMVSMNKYKRDDEQGSSKERNNRNAQSSRNDDNKIDLVKNENLKIKKIDYSTRRKSSSPLMQTSSHHLNYDKSLKRKRDDLSNHRNRKRITR